MMHRKPARRDQKQIIAHKQPPEAGIVPGKPEAGCPFDALALARTDGVARLGDRRTQLDLDEGDVFAATGNEMTSPD